MSAINGENEGASGGSDRTTLDLPELVNWLLAGIVVAVLGAYVYRYVYPGGAASLVGRKAPAFQAESVGSKRTVGLADYRGQTLLLDFWATWCPPCHEQMKYLKELKQKTGVAEKMTIVLVNANQSGSDRRDKVRRYLKQRRLEMTTILSDASMRRKYGVSSYPTLVVIGPDGRVQFAEPGVHPTEELVRIVRDAQK